jgi:hypothetical protein
MDQREIRELLAKYYEGVTSEAEESILQRYLSGPDVPEEFDVDKAWFMSQNMDIPEPGKDFDRKLLSIANEGNERHFTRRKRMMGVYSIAAGIALLIAGYLGKSLLTEKPSYMNDTFTDPDLAMAEVRKVLGLVSDNMTRGTEPLSDINTLGIAPAAIGTFTKAAQTANKSFEKLQFPIEKSSETNEK